MRRKRIAETLIKLRSREFVEELMQKTIAFKSMGTLSSLYINPLRFLIWPTLERDVSPMSYSSVSALKESLMPSPCNLCEEAWKKLWILVEKR